MYNKTTHIAYLGLGTNQGEKEKNIERAIEELSLVLGKPTATAPTIESEPWGYVSSSNYLNTVVSFKTAMTPMELLHTTENIEKKMGRRTKTDAHGYSDRIIDIDILLYDNVIIETPRLTIPHPRLHERQFVLQPLSTIAPTLVHPKTGESISQLLCKLQNDIATEEKNIE
ncbi:MAG: 2-amino-4-hydroxy-6-hydroxymethyldihydropteridine diphosphokinase [Bacteroidaceae bacterium]|nr:2-amino-4-hydroxy-6-hydroxymethyldihydropteridine diphosphokinase [Bacteroidaceae bacterium]